MQEAPDNVSKEHTMLPADVQRSDGSDIVCTSTSTTIPTNKKSSTRSRLKCCVLIFVTYPFIVGCITVQQFRCPLLPPTSTEVELRRFETLQSTYGLRKSSVRFLWGEKAVKMRHWDFSVVVSKGDTFVPGDSSFIFPFPGAFQYTGHVFAPHDYEYVEVMHFYRQKDHHALRDIPSVGQFWYYSAPGSGIWINLGRALRMNTAGRYSPRCEHALNNGYDSYMLSPDNTDLPSTQSHYGGMVEIVDCAGAKADRSNLHVVWEYACPHQNYSSLYHMKNGTLEVCNCNNTVGYLNCFNS